ncbi:MAG: bacteriophage abortive infection AbiH family protein [Streptococcaceae bacterium]|nr:bacteriophage abortive infection AbiH family protein [Streptococcaceae bacterium]
MNRIIDGENSQLNILGNGFDIFCGLHSTYSDFYKARYHKRNEAGEFTDKYNLFYKEIERLLKLDMVGITEEAIGNFKHKSEELEWEITLWDLAFVSKKIKGKDWQDVETEIQYWLKKFRYFEEILENPTGMVMINVVIPDLNKMKLEDYNPIQAGTIQHLSNDVLKLTKIFLVFLRNRYLDRVFTSEGESYSVAILKELNLFENEFAKYLSNEIKNTESYLSNFSLRIQQLCNLGVGSDRNYKFKKHYFLSFNYTLGEITNPSIVFNNVHGKLGLANTIFGIDINEGEHSRAEEPYKFESIFTKTFRTLSLPNYERFYDENIRTIKFFGHSLGDADYSYFRTIFDSVDLINNFDVNLIFVYVNYYDSERKFVNELPNQVERVKKLLLRYEKEKGTKGKDVGYIFDKLRTQGRLSFIDFRKFTGELLS